jgi:hypothetical protein
MPTTINSAGITFNDATSFTSATLAANSVGATQIANGSVTADKLGTNEKKQIAKAWALFNGTLSTPISPSSSFNVSSITKNGTGDYTINFSTALADTSYVVQGSSGRLTTNAGPDGRDVFGVEFGTSGTVPVLKTTSQVRMSSVSTSTNYDGYDLGVIVFGN